jgi:hypothetical protein
MNTFVPDKPKVRVFVNCDGEPIAGFSNIIPELEVEVVTMGEGMSVEECDAALPDSMPFGVKLVDNYDLAE